MAGNCVGPGFTRDEDGKLIPFGPRSAAWPYDCDIETDNGIRIDPGTEKMWVPPDVSVSTVTQQDSGGVVDPDDWAEAGIKNLTQVEKQIVSGCTRALWKIALTSGYAGWRAADGNFWAIQRVVTTYIDGVPSTFSGTQFVSAIENNGGGTIGFGSVPEAISGGMIVEPNKTLKVVALYQLNVLTSTPHAVNALSWTPPRLTMDLISVP